MDYGCTFSVSDVGEPTAVSILEPDPLPLSLSLSLLMFGLYGEVPSRIVEFLQSVVTVA
jgi:hypothetical protein